MWIEEKYEINVSNSTPAYYQIIKGGYYIKGSEKNNKVAMDKVVMIIKNIYQNNPFPYVYTLSYIYNGCMINIRVVNNPPNSLNVSYYVLKDGVIIGEGHGNDIFNAMSAAAQVAQVAQSNKKSVTRGM